MKTAYYNGIVYTGGLPLRRAFIVENGRFRAVGTDEEVLSALAPEDLRIDLEGRFVCAGFNDSHMHLLNFGSVLQTAQLAGHTGSLAELLDYMHKCLAGNPPREGQWLLGRGWNQDLFSDVRRMPDRKDLDTISADIPVMLTRACGHCCVLNTRALEAAGIGPDTEAPGGGAVGLENGVPDGRLYDNAMDLVQRVLPVPGRQEIRDMLRAACREVNRRGITSVQTDDYRAFEGVSWQTVNEVYREMAESGELTLRVYEQAQFTDPESRVGKELAASSYHWKTLMDGGLSVSNGSDCPVEMPDVMAGIRCAVTRTSLDGTGPYLSDQAFSIKEALDSFTVRGAEASFEENIKGRIAPGYLADFTVLSENPFDTSPDRLHEIRVLGCYLGGKQVFG